MQLAAKSVFDLGRVTNTLRALTRDPFGSLTRLVARKRAGSGLDEEQHSLMAEFGRAARVEEDLT